MLIVMQIQLLSSSAGCLLTEFVCSFVWLVRKLLSNEKSQSVTPLTGAAKRCVALMFCIFRKFKTSRRYLTVTLNKEEKDFPLAYSIVIHQKVNVSGATAEVVSLDPASVCGQLRCVE